MAAINWRTIDVDALDPESSTNFDLSTLTPAVQPISTADVQTLAGQVRQLLRGGNAEGALLGALENAPYGADDQGKVGLTCQADDFVPDTLDERANADSVFQGSSSRYSNRSPPIDTASGNDTYPAAHISIRGRV
jgi:hypothetical protein